MEARPVTWGSRRGERGETGESFMIRDLKIENQLQQIYTQIIIRRESEEGKVLVLSKHLKIQFHFSQSQNETG